MLYRLSRLGEVLHFIKHYQCLMLIERHICQRRQIGKERIEVRNVFQKKVFYGFGGVSKVNYRVRPILGLGELLDNIALADTSRAIY